MGQAATKSTGFYPPWVGPERGTVWTLILGLICALVFVAVYVPFAACPANDAAGICVPAVASQSLDASSSSGLALYHSCACNASTTIRTSANARTVSVDAFTVASSGGPDDGRRLSVLSVLFAEFFLNDMYYPRVNATYDLPIPQPDPDFAYPTYSTIPVSVWFTEYGSDTCPNPVSDTTPFLDLSNVYGVDVDYLRYVVIAHRRLY
jgi:hypothetical protein